MPPKNKKATVEQIDLIRRETGAFLVTGAAPGAMIFIDGRLRGDHPLVAPVPTLEGRHWVKIYKEGYSVFEKDVAIAKGGMETLPVTLAPLPHAGRLKIGEVGKRKMEVVVDGVAVGVTPWEGIVSPGPHSVSLRPVTTKPKAIGNTCDDSEETPVAPDVGDPTSSEMGTEPITVNVKEGQTTPLDLKAEQLGAVVRIVPDPPDAEVYIDGVLVGRGPYIGRAKPGKHVVKTKADGYFAKSQEVDAKAGDENSPESRMKKDVNAPKWAAAGRVLFELRGGAPLVPSVGSSIDAACTGLCQQDLGTGVNASFRAGYETAGGFGFGVALGYFQMKQSHVGFKATIGLDEGQRDMSGNVVLTNYDGTANDSVLFQDLLLGAYGSYKFGKRFPVRLGLGAGALLGQLTYIRTGTFSNHAVGPLEQTGFFPWLYIEPEARVGVQITERWSMGVAISGMFVLATKIPQWTQAMQVNAHGANPDELGQFPPEALAGKVFLAFNQGLYLQYGF